MVSPFLATSIILSIPSRCLAVPVYFSVISLSYPATVKACTCLSRFCWSVLTRAYAILISSSPFVYLTLIVTEQGTICKPFM
ncbi:hypothetical protein BTH41_04250 [Bacillus mycoides]|nr:hypothetical protein BTH41_04250 [Bacillus mycoides]